MSNFSSVAVFCGSSSGTKSEYRQAAEELGQLLAQKQINLVYGGSKNGIMGTLANACLEAKGQVTGVIPDFLGSREIAHKDLTELIRVDSMHQRKMIMHEKSEAVIALPGGFGTLEELFEMVTWAQLGIHTKPMGVLNVNGYYQELETFVTKAIDQELIHPKNKALLIFEENPQQLLRAMEQYQAPPSDLNLRVNRT